MDSDALDALISRSNSTSTPSPPTSVNKAKQQQQHHFHPNINLDDLPSSYRPSPLSSPTHSQTYNQNQNSDPNPPPPRHRPLPNAPNTNTSHTNHTSSSSSSPEVPTFAPTPTPIPTTELPLSLPLPTTEIAPPAQSNMLVCVRVRPLLNHDLTQKEVTRILDRRVIIILDPQKVFQDQSDILRVGRSREKRYAFDKVFEPSDNNMEVYLNTTRYLLSGVLDGYNATVFAYGNTGAGKTHTMIGSVEDPGIMALTLRDLFKLSDVHAQTHGVKFRVTVSFIEVYNENIRDLLTDSDDYLDLREDPIKGPQIAGVTEVLANTSDEIMELLHHGNRNRTQQATAANAVSSRSHAVLQVLIENREKGEGPTAKIKIGKLSLVDLAGSERAAATKNKGIRLFEGANINRSLLALGNCINALGEKANKGQFVPYRDSKLTRLLKDSLGGNCRTVMIANISSAVSNFEETLNTLKYANRAKNIKTKVSRNEVSVNHHISEYVNLITDLRSEIGKLKEQILSNPEIEVEDRTLFEQDSGLMRSNANNGGEGDTGNTNAQSNSNSQSQSQSQSHARRPSTTNSEALMDTARTKIVDNFKEKMQLRRSLIELEDQNVSNSIEVGKRQICIAEWNDARGRTPKNTGRSISVGSGGGGGGGSGEEEDAGLSEEFIEKFAPKLVKESWLEVVQLRKAIEKNNNTKRAISKRLRANEKQADKFRSELLGKVTGQDRKQLMELQYRIGKLELDNMELEQSRIIHDSMMKGKDLTIQKLQLQLAVRDKVITQQKAVLVGHNLDHLIGYTGLEIMMQAALTDNFDTLRMPRYSRGRDKGGGGGEMIMDVVDEVEKSVNANANGVVVERKKKGNSNSNSNSNNDGDSDREKEKSDANSKKANRNLGIAGSGGNSNSKPPVNPNAINSRQRRVVSQRNATNPEKDKETDKGKDSVLPLQSLNIGGVSVSALNRVRFNSNNSSIDGGNNSHNSDPTETAQPPITSQLSRIRSENTEQPPVTALSRARSDRMRKRQAAKAAYGAPAGPPERIIRVQQLEKQLSERVQGLSVGGAGRDRQKSDVSMNEDGGGSGGGGGEENSEVTAQQKGRARGPRVAPEPFNVDNTDVEGLEGKVVSPRFSRPYIHNNMPAAVVL